MYYIYVLVLSNGKFYIGQTQDIDKRLFRHQTGQSKYTKPYRPLKLVYKERCESRGEAMRREKYLKSLKDRQYIEDLIKTVEGPIV